MNKFLWDRMLDAALKGNTLTQKFNIRYTDITEPLIALGWSDNCIEWSYIYSSGVMVNVISCYDGFELTMKKINRMWMTGGKLSFGK